MSTTQTLTTLCLLGGQPCVSTSYSVSEWATWVQAVGSVLAILAAVWVARHQSQTAAKLAKAEQRASEVLTCTRALLACEAFLDGLVTFETRLRPLTIPILRQDAILRNPMESVLSRLDPDSLTFLIWRNEQALLNSFALLSGYERHWRHMQDGLQADKKAGTPAPILSLRARAIDKFIMDNVQKLPSLLADVKVKVKRLYPDLVLPEAAKVSFPDPI